MLDHWATMALLSTWLCRRYDGISPVEGVHDHETPSVFTDGVLVLRQWSDLVFCEISRLRVRILTVENLNRPF